jgi:hypothetical protein
MSKVWYDKQMEKWAKNDNSGTGMFMFIGLAAMAMSWWLIFQQHYFEAIIMNGLMTFSLFFSVWIQVRYQRRVQTDYIEKGFRRILWEEKNHVRP